MATGVRTSFTESQPAVPEPATSQAASREHHSDQTTQSSADLAMPDVPPPTRTLIYYTLSFASLNVGGVEITPNRLCHILTGLSHLPQTLSLQEFRPSALSCGQAVVSLLGGGCVWSSWPRDRCPRRGGGGRAS